LYHSGIVTRDLHALFADTLHPLDDGDPRWRGILTPAAELGASRVGVTAQFLENAGEYHARYADLERARRLIERHLDPPRLHDGALTLLDIGSGSGNSVIPLLDLFPGSFVVATDVSPQLLAILRDRLESDARYRGRYGLVCMDATRACFTPGAFDAAVGAAILHHIVDPARVLAACAGALAPGGVALFAEPFEPGYALLRMAYRRILARGESGPGFEVLDRMVKDHDARLRDKSDPIFEALDDKWFFTRAWFERAARDPLWRSWRIEPLNGDETPFLDAARVELRLNGLEPTALPPWAWSEIESCEASFSRDAKRDLVFEGAVRFERSSVGVAGSNTGGARQPRWWWNPREPGSGFFIEWKDDSPRAIAFAYAPEGEPRWSALDTLAIARGLGDRLTVTLGERAVAIEPQNPESPRDPRSGRWSEAHGDSSIVVESLGDRMLAAMLDAHGWSLTVASDHGQAFEGEWLRFSGGQELGGTYRAPSSPHNLGRASLWWPDRDWLVARAPDGSWRTYRAGS
jgi:SAM-dependent methyltransferase